MFLSWVHCVFISSWVHLVFVYHGYIVFQGNDIILEYTNRDPVLPGQSKTFQVPLYEVKYPISLCKTYTIPLPLLNKGLKFLTKAF